MERPKAIIWFERCYLGAFAIKLLSIIVIWHSAHSAVAQAGITIALLGKTIALLLWFGVMYRHSNVSRWIIVTFAIITTIWTCDSAAAGTYGWVMGIVLFVAVILNLTAALQLMSASAGPWFQKFPAEENGEGGMRQWKLGCAISAALLFVIPVLGYMALTTTYPSLDDIKEDALVPDKVQSDSSCPYLLQSIDNANFNWDLAKSAYEKLALSNHLVKSTHDVKCSKLSIYKFFHKKDTIYGFEVKDLNNVAVTHTPHVKLFFYRIVQSDQFLFCEHWKNYSRPSKIRLLMRLNLSGNIVDTHANPVPGFWECTS